jgi:hypothetical protein
MVDFMLGAIATASLVVGLVFLRFYRRTRDRLFVFFAAAFFLDALGRVLEAGLRVSEFSTDTVYAIRIVSFALILVAIIDKNRR